MSLQPATLLAVMQDLVLSLARHGFERVFVINGHGGNIATTKAAFAQAHGTAASSRPACIATSALSPLKLVYGRAQ
jgi:creatinine amidohydrolase